MQRLAIYTAISVGFFAYAISTKFQSSKNIAELLTYGGLITLISINMAFCLFLLVIQLIQYAFFGRLSSDEHKKMWDKMINYLLWKVLVVGAILEPSMKVMAVWTTWLSIVGLMHTFSTLANERFKNLTTFAPNASWWAHGKIVMLLLILLFADLGWFYMCISSFRQQGQTQVFFLYYECFTLFIDVTQLLVRYIIYFVDIVRGGGWENRAIYNYYTEVISTIIILTATLGHYLLLLYFHGLSFNVVDILIFLNIRIVSNNLRAKIKSYQAYRKLSAALQERYEAVSEEELRRAPDNICAICRDVMTTGRRLPCGHIFHTNCLRSSLEFNHSCPTCRFQLLDDAEPRRAAHTNQTRNADSQNAASTNEATAQRRSVWGFNTPSWNRWLPRLSVEVVRQGNQQSQVIPDAQLNEWADTVQSIIPQAPRDAIIQDLKRTGSIEATIGNMLEQYQPSENSSQSTTQPSTQQAPASTAGSAQAVSAASTTPSTVPPSLKDSFKNSIQGRHLSFAQRKQALLEYARDGYLRKQQQIWEAEAARRQANSNK